MATSRWARLIAVATVLGVAVRLAFALGYWTHQDLTRDEREYLSLARSVAAGDGFVYDAVVRADRVQPFGRAPGYPLFLALVGGGTAPSTSVPAAVKIAQSIVGGIGIMLMAVLARRLAGPRAGLAAAVITAFYPPLAWTAVYASSEALYWPMGLAGAWAFDRAADRGATHAARWSLIAGALAGAATLVRPAAIVFVAVAAAWLLWRHPARRAVLFVVATALIIGPWTVRNYEIYGRFVLVAAEGGVTFWTGNHPLAEGDGDLATNVELKRAQQRLRDLHQDLSEEQMEPVYYHDALGWMRAHPAQWLWLEVRKLFYLVVPIGPSYWVHSTLYFLTSALSYATILALAIPGLRRIGGARRRTPGLWLMAGSVILVCLVFFPQERFRLPVIDPALILAASALFADRRDLVRTS